MIEPLLFNDVSGKTESEVVDHIASEFECSVESLGIKRLLICDIDTGPWGCDSSAWILYVGVDGKLYEVHGSHCSCYGFEGQWEPTETTGKYLTSEYCPQNRDDGHGVMSIPGRIRALFDVEGNLIG